MDLNIDLKSQILLFPRNTEITSRAPEGQKGMTWHNKYAFIGLNGMGQTVVSDGLNEQGLYFGSLYLPGFTTYQEVTPENYSKAVAPIDVGMYLLSNAASVDEAKDLIQKVFVWAETTPQVNIIFPLHFSVQDRSGKAAVFEYVEGKLNIHDNPLGILTNSPTFDWHLINLRNFVNLTPNDALGKNLAGLDVKQLGEGSGMLGLPGDFTPPSRFIRGVALAQSALPAQDEKAGVLSMVHIINNFDLVLGVERGFEDKKMDCDFTQWTTIVDLTNLNYFVRMHDNPGFVRVSLLDFDLDGKNIKTIDPNNLNWFTEIKP